MRRGVFYRYWLARKHCASLAYVDSDFVILARKALKFKYRNRLPIEVLDVRSKMVLPQEGHRQDQDQLLGFPH